MITKILSQLRQIAKMADHAKLVAEYRAKTITEFLRAHPGVPREDLIAHLLTIEEAEEEATNVTHRRENMTAAKWDELIGQVTDYLHYDRISEDSAEYAQRISEANRYLGGKVHSLEDLQHPLYVYWTAVNAMSANDTAEHLFELYKSDNFVLFRVLCEKLRLHIVEQEIGQKAMDKILNTPLPAGFDEEKRMPYAIFVSGSRGYVDWLIAQGMDAPELMAKLMAREGVDWYFDERVAQTIGDVGLLLDTVQKSGYRFSGQRFGRDYLENMRDFSYTILYEWRQQKYVINALRNAYAIQQARDAQHKKNIIILTRELEKCEETIAERDAEIARLRAQLQQ